ncbi:MAG: type II secretion system minor pseudopilin GspH [Pseudomonadota bacterium]
MDGQVVKDPMQISCLGCSKRSFSERGITLVELLIVITIMGLMAGVVVMTLPEPSPLQQTAERVERELIALRDDAVVTAQARGLQVLPSGFALFAAQGNEWVEIKTFAVPPTLSLEIKQETDWQLPEHRDKPSFSRLQDAPQEDEVQPPSIRFSPLGEVTPFTLYMLTSTEGVVVSVNGFGDVERHGYGEH